MAETGPVLEVEGLTKRFGALVATDAVTLDLRAGEIHALIGPNGAGKSTLLKQIAGELRPDAGTVRLQGETIDSLSGPERALAGLGRSFQVSALAPELTALQNVMLGEIGRSRTAFGLFSRAKKEAELTARAMERLARVGIQDQAMKPAGILAHGQRRLLEIAIALSLEPRVFLLDEPMAGLGDSGSRELTAFLDGLRQEAPVLLVEHDMDAVFALADRISVLVYGRLIASGSVEEIRANPEVRDAYLGDAA